MAPLPNEISFHGSRCVSCGMPVSEADMKNDLCDLCTLNFTTTPNFETVVIALALSFFMKVKKVQDPQEALKQAWNFTVTNPFWIHKSVPSWESLLGILKQNQRLLRLCDSFEAQTSIGFLESMDFFLSSCEEAPDKEIAEEFALILRNKGYKICVDKRRGSHLSKTQFDQVKTQISVSRFYILFLTRSYLSDNQCQEIMRQILSYNLNLDHIIFPVWYSDVDAAFLKQHPHGSEILQNAGRSWDDYRGNVNTLVQQVEVIYQQKFMRKFKYGNKLLAELDTIAMKDLESLVGPIPELDQEGKFGFIEQDSHIISLALGNNSLKELPNSVYNLKNLIHFKGKIKNLSEKIENLAKIETLDLKGSLMTSLPATLVNLKALKMLNLGYNELTALPENIGNLSALETLNLSELNQLSALPVSIGDLKSLKTLDLGFNKLHSLPSSIVNLDSLQTLNLIHNKLTALPDNFDHLKSLTKLNLSYNLFQSIPELIGNLSELQSLDLGGNQLTSLPENFKNLAKLQELNLWNNQFKLLPECLIHLIELKQLDLRFNQLTQFSQKITMWLKYLKFLKCKIAI